MTNSKAAQWGFVQSPNYIFVPATDKDIRPPLEAMFQCKLKGDLVIITYRNPFSGEPMTFKRGSTGEIFEYMRVRLLDAIKPSDTKYLSPKESSVHLYFSPLIEDSQWVEYAQNRNVPLVIVEGEKKADYLTRFFPMILPVGISGVWQWSASKEEQHLLNLKAQLKYRRIYPKNSENITTDELEGWLFVVKLRQLLAGDKTLQGIYDSALLDEYLEKYSDGFISGSKVPAIGVVLDKVQQDVSTKVHRLDQKKILGALATAHSTIKSDNDQKCLHPELVSNFKLNNRDILICFDSDLDRLAPRVNDTYTHNPILGAANELCQALSREGAKPILVPLIKPPLGSPRYGVDDFAKYFSDKAVEEILELSLTYKGELGLILNPDRPKTKDAFMNQAYKILNPHKFSKELSSNIAGIILRYFSNVVYRHNRGWYKFNGIFWELVKGGDTEIQHILNKALKFQPELYSGLKPKDVAPYAAVEESKWNQGEAQGKILLANGVYDLVTSKFTSIEDVLDIKHEYFTGHIGVNYKTPSKKAVSDFKSFMSHYAPTKAEFRYLLAMSFWLLFPKQYFVCQRKKFPVEKMFYLVGSQGTGKSTFLEFLTKTVASSRVAEISPDNLDTVTGLGNYSDATLWKSNDFSGNVSKDVIETFNKVISGEALESRLLYKQSEMKVIAASIILAGNDTLSFPQKGTQGILRRLVYIPFNTPVKEYNREVIEYTASEEALSVFFYFITKVSLDDCIEILNNSQWLPVEYAQMTSTSQESNDTIADFFLTRILPQAPQQSFVSGATAKSPALYRATLFNQYTIYCKDNGIVNHFTAFKLEKLLRSRNFILHRENSDGVPLKYQGQYLYDINTDISPDYSVESLRLTSGSHSGKPLEIDKFLG